jgi:hypothetical protein
MYRILFFVITHIDPEKHPVKKRAGKTGTAQGDCISHPKVAPYKK